MSDSRVPPPEVVNRVARLVSSTEHTAGFHNLLGDTDIDRFTNTEHTILFGIPHVLVGRKTTGNTELPKGSFTAEQPKEFFFSLSMQYHHQSEAA